MAVAGGFYPFGGSRRSESRNDAKTMGASGGGRQGVAVAGGFFYSFGGSRRSEYRVSDKDGSKKEVVDVAYTRVRPNQPEEC